MNSPYIKYVNLLSEQEKKQLDNLLHIFSKWPLELEEMWRLMNIVWDELGCDNENLDEEKIREYYMHPVWLLNGLFAESHAISMEHRNSISDWIVENKVSSMLDYGGGFCTLSRLVADKSPSITIDILEPFPAAVSKRIIAQYPQIHFIDNLEKKYDCIVALDVLEHLPDPLQVLASMIQATRINGTLLIGNCFQPVIKCHLPRTFHLHHSFRQIVSKMNVDYHGTVSGCHAEIYKRNRGKDINKMQIRALEALSKLRYTVIKLFQGIKKFERYNDDNSYTKLF